MKVFAYCANSFGRSIKRVAGTSPLLSPPHTIDTFHPALIEGYDLLYFKLHGLPNESYWYGDNWTTALSAEQLKAADLKETIVFVSNCWLLDNNNKPGPMLQALAHAKAVIGGPGENYALPNKIGGVDLLGLYIRVFLQLGLNAKLALQLAQWRLEIKRPTKITTDTLAFKLFTGGNQ